MSFLKYLGLGAGGLAIGTYGASVYFFNTVMKRSTRDTERSMKMSGTDWESYFPIFEKSRAYISQYEKEDVYITSEDGLKLHGIFYPNGGSKKLMVCCHGYTGNAESNFVAQAAFFLSEGYALLMVDARAHGESEGTYVGFGCLDRYDVRLWLKYIIGRIGDDVSICLYGVSMGGATVLMTAGIDIPDNVKGVIADCPFTSPKEVFSFCLKTMYHLPAAPILSISEQMSIKKAGYGLDECNSKREVKNAKVPILLIHGTKDTFVPTYMTKEIEANCVTPVKMLLIEDAAHAESYMKDTNKYQKYVREFLEEII